MQAVSIQIELCIKSQVGTQAPARIPLPRVTIPFAVNPETIFKQSEADQEKQQEQTPQQCKCERKMQTLICQKSCEGDTCDLGRGQEGVPSWRDYCAGKGWLGRDPLQLKTHMQGYGDQGAPVPQP